MAIFNSYVKLPEGNQQNLILTNKHEPRLAAVLSQGDLSEVLPFQILLTNHGCPDTAWQQGLLGLQLMKLHSLMSLIVYRVEHLNLHYTLNRLIYGRLAKPETLVLVPKIIRFPAEFPEIILWIV